MPIDIHFNLAALVLTVVVSFSYYSHRRLNISQNRVFELLTFAVFITVLFDIICAITQNYSAMFSKDLHLWLNMGYFASRSLISSTFSLYIIAVSGRYKTSLKLYRWILIAPLVVLAFAIAATPAYQFIFYIDDTNTYVRGAGIIVPYIVSGYFLVFTGIYAFNHRKVMPQKICRAIYYFMAITILPVILQYIFPNLLVEAFGISLCLLAIYLAIQRPEEMLDAETGVLNRAAWNTTMPAVLSVDKGLYTVTLILEDYVALNRALGNEVFNDLIVNISTFLRKTSDKNPLYRVSQHCFTVLVDSDNLQDAENVANQILERFNLPWESNNGSVKIKARICIVDSPGYASTPEEILECISTVEHLSKSKQIVYSSDIENKFFRRRQDVIKAVEDAIEKKNLQVFYQPIYNVKTGKCSSAEALVRLHDDELGNISPEEFIPIAEDSGSILKIGRFVLENVCRFYNVQGLAALGVECIDVNLSVIECVQDNLAPILDKILKTNKIPFSAINLEITETAQAYSLETFKNNVDNVHNLGFKLSLDDYGTGYATMKYILDLPFHTVKLDKSIVWAAFESDRARGVLQSVIGMLKSLKMQIVAEGVETKEQAQLLKEWGCDYLQGYYFARPVCETEYLKLLEKEFIIN